MRHFIEITEPVVSKDARGFDTVTDKVLARVRAYAEPRRGTHQWANLAAFSTATIKFQFRIIPGLPVTPSMAIIYNGLRYRLTSVDDVSGLDRYIEVYAEDWEPKAGG